MIHYRIALWINNFCVPPAIPQLNNRAFRTVHLFPKETRVQKARKPYQQLTINPVGGTDPFKN